MLTKDWKNLASNLKMPYPHFISMKLDSKSGQTEGLDTTFQIYSTAKIFDIVEYLKN